MRRRLRCDSSSLADSQTFLTGTYASPGARRRAANHAPDTDPASISKVSIPAWVATCCTIHPGSNALRVEKLTAIEEEGTWRDIVALSGLCVGDHARRRAR